MCRRIGEYISLELFYFVKITSSCSRIPSKSSCLEGLVSQCFSYRQKSTAGHWTNKISFKGFTVSHNVSQSHRRKKSTGHWTSELSLKGYTVTVTVFFSLTDERKAPASERTNSVSKDIQLQSQCFSVSQTKKRCVTASMSDIYIWLWIKGPVGVANRLAAVSLRLLLRLVLLTRFPRRHEPVEGREERDVSAAAHPSQQTRHVREIIRDGELRRLVLFLLLRLAADVWRHRLLPLGDASLLRCAWKATTEVQSNVYLPTLRFDGEPSQRNVTSRHVTSRHVTSRK